MQTNYNEFPREALQRLPRGTFTGHTCVNFVTIRGTPTGVISIIKRYNMPLENYVKIQWSLISESLLYLVKIFKAFFLVLAFCAFAYILNNRCEEITVSFTAGIVLVPPLNYDKRMLHKSGQLQLQELQ